MLSDYFKGLLGEFINKVDHRLRLPRKDYFALHNIIIPSLVGTTEIDHVVVSRFGVFVIETKYWSGWLFGSAHDKTWTRVVYQRRHQVRNPLRQNHGHKMALAELLGIKPDLITALVALRGATFKSAVPEGVVVGGYARWVRASRKQVLKDDEVDRIIAVLESDRVRRGLLARMKHAILTRARHRD